MRRLRRAHQRNIKKRMKLRRRAITAGTVAAITLGTGASLNKALAAHVPDRHELVVGQDADADLIANSEEIAIGYRPFDSDQNRNEIPDGVELAKRCAAVIQGLYSHPPYSSLPPPMDEPFKVEHALDGVELCDVCGREIHMGGWEIFNPVLGLRYPDLKDPLSGTFLPDLALHYMEHGSFDCYGDYHKGRVDLARLLRVLDLRWPCDPNEHELGVDENDLDSDLLTDSEELAAGYDMYDADQDSDLTPDGADLAKQCAEVIEALPVCYPDGPEIVHSLYKVQFFQWGLETCDVCGQTVNMGYWQIVNAKLGISMEVPEIVCHYMKHGSFSYTGDVHKEGRIDVALLAKILQMPRRCGDLGTIYAPGDLNNDCQVNFADVAEFAEHWLECTDPNTNDNSSPPAPSVTYRVGGCEPGTVQTSAQSPSTRGIESDQPKFSANVVGSYIYFEDLIGANCCPDKIELEMTIDKNVVTTLEKEYLTSPCRCWCSFPITAALGPFDDGTYTLEVYLLNGISNGEPAAVRFVGKMEITIGTHQ